MKLPPSGLLIKLFSDLPLASRRSSSGGKVLLGSLVVVLSVFITISYFPGIELPSMNLAAAATPATSNLPLFGNPTSEDFMSYAVSIMPKVPGANLNTSNVAGSTNCDLLVPVTYIDAGCMNSLPLLFPFNEQQQTNVIEPTNQTFYNYSNSSALDLSIGVASDNITAGDTQTVTVTVSDQNSTQPITGALVLANVTDSFNSLLHEYSGTTDEVGQVSFPFVIPVDAAADIYTVSVLASADGYENTSASTTFDVIGSGDFFDNSTSDNFSDGSSSSDNCCSDSSSSNDDFTSPTVKSTDPSDGDNNVATDLSQIKVTFSESIDKNSVDTGSLSVFADNCGTISCNSPDIQDVSVSSKSVTFSINSNDRLSPDTNYIASISSSIQDQDGNFLDCFNSKGVDDNCEWNFNTGSGSAVPPAPSIVNPQSGSFTNDNTPNIAGTTIGSLKIEVFDGSDSLGTTTASNGLWSLIPPQLSDGSHTLTATAEDTNTGNKSPKSSPGVVFTVDTQKPTVTGTNPPTPPPPVTDVPTGKNITAKFSELMRSSSINSQTFLLKFSANNTNVPGTVSLSSNGTTAIFDPSSLANSTSYTATITTGVTDLAGNSLASDYTWSFTTGQSFSPALATTETTPSSPYEKMTTNNSIAPSTNQSNATLVLPFNNKSNASAPMVANSTFNTAGSNDTISLHSNAPPVNASSSQATANTSTASAKELNNTSLITSANNRINNNPSPTTSTQNNDTSNSKKSSEKNISINDLKSNDQPTPVELTKDNTTHKTAQNESRNPLSDAKVKNKDISTNDSEPQTGQNSVTEKPTSLTEDKTITKVKSPNSDNQPDKQSRSSDSIKRDRALFFKYLNSDKNDVKEEDKTEVNNRPVAVNDEATTESNIPVKINILSNDKDPDGDKLSVMGVSRPVRGTIESDADGTITYSPLKSWSGTERFGYTISDGRGGVATGTVTVIVQNQPPEAEDQDISVNANSPIKIKLEAKDPDDDKLKFVLETKPSHGRIAQFSISTGTLAYIPDANYDGKDEFTFKVHDGTEFSKDAKVSIKIENNLKSSNDQVKQNDKQQKKEPSRQSPTNENKPADDKSNNNDTPPSDSSDQSGSPTQDSEQQKSDVKDEQKQSSEPDKSTSNGDTAPSGDSPPNS